MAHEGQTRKSGEPYITHPLAVAKIREAGLVTPVCVAVHGVYSPDALSVLRDTPFVFAANWDLSAIPMFLLMGAIASDSPPFDVLASFLDDFCEVISCDGVGVAVNVNVGVLDGV